MNTSLNFVHLLFCGLNASIISSFEKNSIWKKGKSQILLR